MALITAAQFREHFPALIGTGEDTIVNTLVTRADALMAAWCGFPRTDAGVFTFEDNTYTLYLDAPWSVNPRRLDLGVHHVVSITSAAVDSTNDWTWATTIPSTDYATDVQALREGHLWLKPSSTYSWYTQARANKVVVVAGFTTTPDDLIATTAAMVVHLNQLRKTQGLQTINMGGGSITKSDQDGADFLVPHVIQEALSRYRLWGANLG